MLKTTDYKTFCIGLIDDACALIIRFDVWFNFQCGIYLLLQIRIRSVAEALSSALRELAQHSETYGVDLDSTGCMRPTDVLRRSIVPKQYQTLTEKVGIFFFIFFCSFCRFRQQIHSINEFRF